MKELRATREEVKEWLIERARIVRSRWSTIDRILSREDVPGAMLKSYGQAVENVIIFTLSPAAGMLYATDRKLAEFVAMDDVGLLLFSRGADEELQGYSLGQD